jgi:hypothetical protein
VLRVVWHRPGWRAYMSIFKTFLPGTGIAVDGRHGMRQSRRETMPISRSEYGPVCLVFEFHGYDQAKQIAVDIPVGEVCRVA